MKTKEPKAWVAFEWEMRLGWKTALWRVVSLNGDHLGEVKWFGRWRQYAFYPTQSTMTIHNPVCLRQIADFCEEQTIAHRDGKTEKVWVVQLRKGDVWVNTKWTDPNAEEELRVNKRDAKRAMGHAQSLYLHDEYRVANVGPKGADGSFTQAA